VARAITCPSCGESGELGHRQRGFEPRGFWEDTEDPVCRCINCGSGVAVRSRPFGWGARVEQIDPDVWGRLEYKWGRENPLPATEVPATPSAEELVRQLRETTVNTDHLVHLVAEAAEVSESAVRRILVRPEAS
jgi:DNA-directed RNA polymerase subunit RPC12/RpoP